MQERLDTRSLPEHLHQWLVDNRQYFALDNLLNNQRYSQNHEWMYLCKCFHQGTWSRRLGQEIELSTVAYLIEELKGQTKHVRDRQHGHHFVTWLVRNLLTSKVDITAQVLVGQHHTLRVTSRTRSVVNKRYIVVVISRIINILSSKTIRPLFVELLVDSSILLLHLLASCMLETEIIHKDHCGQTRHLSSVHFLEYVRTNV